ncbi:hypothetical protein I4U23_023580 [Adineta vaga]|nr:hypothetical protein I4U23_023580 [Adineta vaga]
MNIMNLLPTNRNPVTKKIFSKECRICRNPAQYSYFGVVSCQSCKMFFKRNANSMKGVIKCKYDGKCKVNKNTRHLCAACRLEKCFQYGMNVDRFRPARQTKLKDHNLVKVQKTTQLSTLNLLQSDQSLLTSSQWTLLTNLYHSYKESQLLSFGQHFRDIHYNSQSTPFSYTLLFEEFLALIYQTTGGYLCSNGDLNKLSVNDRSLVLRGVADNVACMTGTFAIKQCQLYSLQTFFHTMKLKYNEQTMNYHLWAMKYIDSDIVVVKLAISLFALTQHSSIHTFNISINSIDTITMLNIQNTYTEVTWKYLIYRYGCLEAMKRFLNLSLWLRSITMLTHHARTLAPHINDIDSLVEQTELKLLLDDIDQIFN